MKRILCLLVVFFGTFIYSQSKQDKVKELISLNGAFTVSKKFEEKFIETFKNNNKYSNVPEKAWTAIAKKIDVSILINEVAEIYGSNFTEKEIDQLIIFYKSEIGKKVLQNGMSIGSKIQESTRNWAMKATQTINEDLEKMGFSTPPQSKYLSPPPPMESKQN